MKLHTRLDVEAINVTNGRTETPGGPASGATRPARALDLVDEVLVRVGRRQRSEQLDWPPIHLVHQHAYRVKRLHLGEARMRGRMVYGGRIRTHRQARL